MHYEFDVAMFENPITYTRGGRAVFLDSCRRMLVAATPEEEVRQKFVMYLEQKFDVPSQCIETEANLAHFKRGARGRADIIVYSVDRDRQPVLLAECKAGNVPITDHALNQVLRYQSIVGGRAKSLVITNGSDTRWYQLDSNGEPIRLDAAPSYSDLVEGGPINAMEVAPRPQRASSGHPTDEAISWFIDQGIIGYGSPRDHYYYLANMAGLVYLEPSEPLYAGRNDTFKICATGERETVVGNAAGGNWPGAYRYFIIDDAQGETQIVSMAILGKDHGYDPRFGEMNGHTMLIVQVDDNERSHSSLQLDLDKFVDQGRKEIILWHDGTLTRGKKGRVKSLDVVQFVFNEAPYLVRHGRICLGSLPTDRAITWTDAESFIYNVIEYALIRDRFRQSGTAP